MSAELYQRLAQHLDSLPGGYPAHPDGVEQRILRRLFTPEQAELALHLSLMPRRAAGVAKRAGISEDEATARLEEMANCGLCFSMRAPGGGMVYLASQYVLGIWEYSVQRLDQGLAEDMAQYAPVLMEQAWKVPQLRTIPVHRAIEDNGPAILAHEAARELVKDHKHMVVAPCICRKQRKLMGEGCDRMSESCLLFGWAARFYEERGLGRRIDLAECQDILVRADEEGLVLQPTNSQKIAAICTCCGCCCEALVNIKKLPDPGRWIASPLVCRLDDDTCTACGTCVDRCPMGALTSDGAAIHLDPARCIGCGLCVSTCPTGAVRLERKPEELQRPVPATLTETLVQLGRERGLGGRGGLGAWNIYSKMERLLGI